MQNESELMKVTGEILVKIPLSECVVAETEQKAAEEVLNRKYTSERKGCAGWEEEKVKEYEGTSVAGNIEKVKATASADPLALSVVHTHIAPVAGQTVVMLNEDPLPAHSAEPNSEWRLVDESLQLVAIKDILPKELFTVSYGLLSTHLLAAKHCVSCKGDNPADCLEIAFEVPPAIIPTLTPYFRESATVASAAGRPAPSVFEGPEGNVTRHHLTLADPYPITLRLAARAHQGPESTEEMVDCCLEKLFTGMRDALQSRDTQQDVRADEFDILISSLSRLHHTTTLRKDGACHKVLREPPTLKGETLAGVPLTKCLSLETACAMGEISNSGKQQHMTEKQIRTLQVAYMKENIEAFVPNPLQTPMYWSDEELKELEGTEAMGIVAQLKSAADADVTHIKSLAVHVTDDAWKWAAALTAKSTVKVTIPEETVRINISEGEAQPVMWEDVDGDRIKFRVEDGALLYSVNGEDRPAIEQIEVVDGVSLRFPLIDREIDLVSPNHPGDAYRLVFSYIRALAESASVKHDIPKFMEFTKQAKEVDVIIPGAAKLAHHPLSKPLVYQDNSVWCVSSGGGTDVSHIPNAGNGELLAKRGEMAAPNPYTEKVVEMKIPCRALGAEETGDDRKHGMMLQCANVIAEQSHEIEVKMPDIEELQSGNKVFFTVRHKLTAEKPIPKSLLWTTMISLLPSEVLDASLEQSKTLDGLYSLLSQHGSPSKAVEVIKPLVTALSGLYPTSLEDDQASFNSLSDKDTRLALALRLRIEEKSILKQAVELLEKLQQ